MRAAAIVLTASCFAAATPAAQQPPARPAFKSGVQLLEVDARVFDRQGRFVRDLTMNDFEILEKGVPQTIQTMFLVGDPATTTRAPERAAATQILPRVPQTWIFIFDHRHMRMNGFNRAKVGVEGFIADRFRAGDLAGVVMDGRMVNNRITSVREEFMAAIGTVKVPGDAEARAADQADADAAGGGGEAGANIREALNAMTAAEVKRAARATTEMLDELAKGLAAMPGPKTVVLLSDGFGMADLEGTLRTVVGRMNRAGARIYAIDTKGLAGPPGDTINSLAVDTGGLVIFNINNTGHALDEVAADTNVYYVLGYQPANSRYDGKYREIEVRVKRPDVLVRARKGYLALEPSKMLVPQRVK
jgi:VWFA-related protein